MLEMLKTSKMSQMSKINALVPLILCLFSINCVSAEPIRIGFLTPYPNVDSAVPLRLADEWISALRLSLEFLGPSHPSFSLQPYVQNSDCHRDSGRQAAERLVRSNVVAVVGPACSEAAIGAADVLGQHGIPLLSFAATAAELADRTAYPTFFRLVYPDSYQAKAVLDTTKLLNSTKLYVIYSDEAYGRGLVKSIVTENIARNPERSHPFDVISMPAVVPVPPGGYGYLFSSLTVEPRVPVLFAATPRVAHGLWQAALEQRKLDYPWWYIGTDGVTAFDLIGEGDGYRDLAYSMQGEIGLYPFEGNVSEGSPYRQILDHWSNLTYSSYPGLLTFPRFPRYSRPRAFVPYLVDSVWTMYEAIARLVDRGISVTPDALLSVLSDPQFSFEGCTGTVAFKPFTGERDTGKAPPEYNLVSLSGTTWNVVGTWKSTVGGTEPNLSISDTTIQRPGNGSDTVVAEFQLPAVNSNGTADELTVTAGPGDVSAPEIAPDLTVQPLTAPVPSTFEQPTNQLAPKAQPLTSADAPTNSLQNHDGQNYDGQNHNVQTNGTANDDGNKSDGADSNTTKSDSTESDKSTLSSTSSTSPSTSLSSVAIAGIVAPIVLLVLLAGIGIYQYVQKKRQEASSFVRML